MSLDALDVTVREQLATGLADAQQNADRLRLAAETIQAIDHRLAGRRW